MQSFKECCAFNLKVSVLNLQVFVKPFPLDPHCSSHQLFTSFLTAGSLPELDFRDLVSHLPKM